MPGSNKKRDVKAFKQNQKKMVNEKFVKLDVVSFSGFLELNENSEPDSIQVFGPDNTPLDAFLQDEDLKKKLFDVCVETLMRKYEGIFLENVAQKRKDNNDKIQKVIRKPPVPVSSMTHDQLLVYFPNFISDIYKIFDLKINNKWALPIKDGRPHVIPPSPPCPHWNNGIIEPSTFFGTGRIYKHKNITMRMRLQITNILLEMNENPDTFSDHIPDNYVPKNFTREDLNKFSQKISKMDNASKEKRNVANVNDEIDPDDIDIDEDEINHDEDDEYANIFRSESIKAANALIDEGEMAYENLDYLYEEDQEKCVRDKNNEMGANLIRNHANIIGNDIREIVQAETDSLIPQNESSNFSIPSQSEAGPSWWDPTSAAVMPRSPTEATRSSSTRPDTAMLMSTPLCTGALVQSSSFGVVIPTPTVSSLNHVQPSPSPFRPSPIRNEAPGTPLRPSSIRSETSITPVRPSSFGVVIPTPAVSSLNRVQPSPSPVRPSTSPARTSPIRNQAPGLSSIRSEASVTPVRPSSVRVEETVTPVRPSLNQNEAASSSLTPTRLHPSKEHLPDLTPGSLKVKRISKAKKVQSQNALTPGFIRGVYEGKKYEDYGRIQFLSFRDVKDGTFFKFNDGEYCGYNIVGGSKIVKRIKQLAEFTVIEIVGCYRQGFGIVIEDFKVLQNPGHLIVSDTVSQICFLDGDYLEKIANQAGASDDNGNKNSEHPFFKNRSPILLRKTRSRSEKSSETMAKKKIRTK